MTDNTKVWDALCKTDPAHTKGFKRAGGFSGTAVKPIYCEQRMTALFGPCGKGWGINKPEFQLVPAGDELMVYCTASIWHGEPSNVIYGVGGDKVVSKGSNGSRTSDEAFKMAFTDAIGNAMKHLGMSADIHMGMFDDAKYVREMEHEFHAPKEAPTQAARVPLWDRESYTLPTGPKFILTFCGAAYKAPSLDALSKLNDDNKPALQALSEADYTPCRETIKRRYTELSQAPLKADAE